MTYKIAPTAKAMTAIAAALAFTSTPGFAQDTGAAPDASVETPAAADPLAPDPVAEQAPAAAESAPPPAPKPKVETRTATAKPARASAAAAATRTAPRRASAATPVAAPVEPAAPVVEPVAPAPPAAAAPAATEPAPPPIAEPAPASGTTGALMADIMADDRLPYAGGAALGLLALGGAGLVARRRKRRRENEAFEARQQFLERAEGEAEPPVLELDRSAEVRPGPAFARPTAPIHDPVPAKTTGIAKPLATKLPNGFDLSRFGPHVQAAYRGPTADNPSLSLKYRLRRAAALDQQERNAAQQAGAARAEAPASVSARGKWESRADADFLFRRASEPAEREVEPG